MAADQAAEAVAACAGLAVVADSIVELPAVVPAAGPLHPFPLLVVLGHVDELQGTALDLDILLELAVAVLQAVGALPYGFVGLERLERLEQLEQLEQPEQPVAAVVVAAAFGTDGIDPGLVGWAVELVAGPCCMVEVGHLPLDSLVAEHAVGFVELAVVVVEQVDPFPCLDVPFLVVPFLVGPFQVDLPFRVVPSCSDPFQVDPYAAVVDQLDPSVDASGLIAYHRNRLVASGSKHFVDSMR